MLKLLNFGYDYLLTCVLSLLISACLTTTLVLASASLFNNQQLESLGPACPPHYN